MNNSSVLRVKVSSGADKMRWYDDRAKATLLGTVTANGTDWTDWETPVHNAGRWYYVTAYNSSSGIESVVDSVMSERRTTSWGISSVTGPTSVGVNQTATITITATTDHYFWIYSDAAHTQLLFEGNLPNVSGNASAYTWTTPRLTSTTTFEIVVGFGFYQRDCTKSTQFTVTVVP